MPSSGAGSGSVGLKERVLHVRRVAVHLERGDRPDALFEIAHRRKRSARNVVGENAPPQRRRVNDLQARQAKTRARSVRQLRERHSGGKDSIGIATRDAYAVLVDSQAIALRRDRRIDTREDLAAIRHAGDRTRANAPQRSFNSSTAPPSKRADTVWGSRAPSRQASDSMRSGRGSTWSAAITAAATIMTRR